MVVVIIILIMVMGMVKKIMTDIHNHLLYGIDDGSKSIEESIDILKDMKKCGFDNIILTPHYIKDSKWNNPRKDNLERMSYLQRVINENNIDINLYLGNEIFIDEDIYENINRGLISPLNDTSYLLIELPMTGEYEDYKDIFRDLIKKGYHVILAHPERYHSFQEDFNRVYELEKIGVYFQSNLDSIVGGYGENAEKMIKRLLREKKIAFLATDIHHKKHDYNKWVKAKKVALKYITEREFEILTNQNPSQLLG